jgi:hypothetical protein
MKTEERNLAFKKKQNEPKYLQEWTSRVKKMGSSQFCGFYGGSHLKKVAILC